MKIQTVKEIIKQKGHDNIQTVPTGTHYEIEVDGYEPLVIEKLTENKVSVAHYYEQHGDLMADPDILFRIDGDTWIPIEYTHHGLGIYQHDKEGLQDLSGFIKTWDRNLRKQGFIEATTPEVNA